MQDDKPKHEVLGYAPPNLQTVRGRPMRVLRTFGLPVLVVEGLIMLPVWFAHYSTQFKIAVVTLVMLFGVIATICLMLAAAFAAARVVNEQLEFIIFGIRTRTIPLATIRAYKHFMPGSPAICILYGSGSSYVPNGTLDQKELINLLHAHGVAEEAAK